MSALCQQQTHALQHDRRLFSVLRLIFKHKQKDRLAAVFLFPSRRQCIKVGIRTPTGANNLGDGETPAGVRAA
jgi:hypothetical protein